MDYAIIVDLIKMANLQRMKIILNISDDVEKIDEIYILKVQQNFLKYGFKKSGTKDNNEKIAARELFRFWHNYGFVLSDETLYSLFKSMFFHSIFMSLTDPDNGWLKKKDNTFSDQWKYVHWENIKIENGPNFYSNLIDQFVHQYPYIKFMGILNQKLKHFVGDHHAIEGNIQLIYQIWVFYFELFINLFIILYIYEKLGPTDRTYHSNYHKQYAKFLPEFYKHLAYISPNIQSYLQSSDFEEYIQKDFDNFNSILQGNCNFPIFTGEGNILGNLTLSQIKGLVGLDENDPINGLLEEKNTRQELIAPAASAASASASASAASAASAVAAASAAA